MQDIADALASGRPLHLLAEASSVMSALVPRAVSPFDKPDLEQLTLAEFVHTLIEVPLHETSALLAAISALTDDATLRGRIRRELRGRPFALPDWLSAPDGVVPHRVLELTDVLGDGESIFLGTRLPEGGELTALVFVDHNLGSVVTDAFVVDEPLEVLVTQITAAPDFDEDASIDELDPAQARARLTEAIQHGAITFPPYETDTWPGCRPLVEWLCRSLPDGGRGYERREWTERETDALAARIVASPHGRDLDEDHRSLLDSLLWYGTSYSTGDPLRWSPPKIEVLMLDWLPRKIVADAGYLAKAPEALRALIRFGHAESGIRADLTADALDAVDRFEPEYQQIIRSPRPQGPMALLAAMGAIDPNGPWDALEESPSWEEHMRQTLVRAVGGEAALANLDDAALPDEEFDWDGVPLDVHDAVSEVLAILDDVVDRVLGVEYRTACRRLLHRVASADAEVFRRRARTDVGAAAVCWIVAKVNRLFDGGGMRVKHLLAEFGVTGSVSQRANAFLAAGGFGTDHYGQIDLGAPDLLVAARRRRILELRERYEAD